MVARLLRQMALFIISMASSIVVGWLLMDQMERNRREEERQREIPVPRGGTDNRNGAREKVSTGAPTVSAPSAAPSAAPKPASTGKKATKADDLTIIEGIGPAYAKALNALGIRTFGDLAQQD